jgi:hypothetical protein
LSVCAICTLRRVRVCCLRTSSHTGHSQRVVLTCRKDKKRRKRDSSGPWAGADGWKAVTVDDDFLLGAAEGGFGGLEVLENPTVIDSTGLVADSAAAPSVASRGTAEPDGAEGPRKKRKKARKDKVSTR